MSYKKALEAAGAEVLAFETFGSYQGDWFAKVRYEGEVFWLRDYYGSCSGCDAFEADVGYSWGIPEEEYNAKVAEFGKRYLEPSERLTFEQALEIAGKDNWDNTSEDMVKFVKENE